jgi:hypothetical protein
MKSKVLRHILIKFLNVNFRLFFFFSFMLMAIEMLTNDQQRKKCT